MKQTIIAIAMLAIAMALVISVIIPILEHGAETGNDAAGRAKTVVPVIEQILK